MEQTTQWSRRRFLQTAGMVGAAAALAACAPAPAGQPAAAPVGGEAAAPDAAAVELVGWTVQGFNPVDEQHQPYRDAVMDYVNERHPNTTFTWMDMGWDEVLRQNFVTALLGGTAPDLIVGENYIQPYARDGAFLPLDDVVADVRDNLIEGTIAAAMLDGNLYGVSKQTNCFGFERNPNVIEQAGLDPDNPPVTWSDLIAQAEQITAAGNGEYYGYTLQGPVGFLIGGILRFAVYHKTAQAELCQEDCTMPYFNNPASERVLTFLREIHRSAPPGLSFNPDEGEVYTQLFLNRSAYQVAGGWHVNWARETGLENARYSAIPIPDEDGVQATGVVGNVIVSVVSGTNNPEEATYFCRALVDDSVQRLVQPLLNTLPSTRSVLTELRGQVDEAYVMFIDQLLTADLGVLPQWPSNPQLVWAAYNNLITQLLTTEQPVQTLMEQAQAEAEAGIEQGA
jgi:multiple sugar transport system substrate-binding protein